MERARDVVVAATVERAHAVDGVRFRVAEHDHRHATVPRPARLAFAEAPADVELGGEEDEVGTYPLGERERRLLVVGTHDLEAVVREMALEEATDALLGLRQEQCL